MGEQSAYRHIDDSLEHRAVELGDDVVARTFGSPQALPPGNVETRYMTGILGAANQRALAITPYALILPSRRSGNVADASAHMRSTCPATKSWYAGARPR